MALIVNRADAGGAQVLPYAGRLSPADKVIIGYLVIIVILAIGFSGSIGLSVLLTAGHAIMIAGIVLLACRSSLSRCPSFLGLLHGWYPLVLIPLTYKEMEFLIPRVNPGDLDWHLAAIDYRLFGVHPTVWLERLTHPLVTELLQLAYICYYFLPLSLGIPLWLRGRFKEFNFLLFVLVLGFYLSYLGYIAVPAIGPRFILRDYHTTSLSGLLLYETIGSTLDWAEGITRDCFPSGHTEVALLVLYYARKFDRRIFWPILPVATALIFSTVYLRYHYVVDLIAGALLALAVVLVARPLYRVLGGDSVRELD